MDLVYKELGAPDNLSCSFSLESSSALQVYITICMTPDREKIHGDLGGPGLQDDERVDTRRSIIARLPVRIRVELSPAPNFMAIPEVFSTGYVALKLFCNLYRGTRI